MNRYGSLHIRVTYHERASMHRVARQQGKPLSQVVRDEVLDLDDGCEVCGAATGEPCAATCEDRR